MKKLLWIVVLGLIWCNISFANNTHSYLLKNELIVLFEGQNWKIKFMNNGKITSEFKGETTYDFSWKKINDYGTYEVYHSNFRKPNLWEINLNNNTFNLTDLRGSNKKYTYQILKSQNSQSASNNNSSAGTGNKIAQSKQICKDLGFKVNTEKFADCALKMMSMQFEASNKVASSGGTKQEIIVKHKNDYDIWDALLDTSALLRNNNTGNSSSSSGTNCRIVPKAWGADMVCR